MAVFLTVNGYLFHVSQSEAVEQCVKIASDTEGVNLREVSNWIRSSSINLKAFIRMSEEQQERRLDMATGGMELWGRFLAAAVEVTHLLNE